MKHLFTAAAMLFSMTAFAQVGINNNSPKATLDITAKTTDGSKPEGLIIPQISGNNIHTATAAGVYGTNQKGLIIYVTSADSAPISATANITTAGYYYFDGTNWQKVMTGSIANSDLTTGVGGIYKGSGYLSGNTTVTQGGNTLAFTSTTTNGFSVDGTTLSVDAANNRVGIGTSTPSSTLEINSGTANTSGVKLTNLPSVSLLATDSNGNIISGSNSTSGVSISKQRLVPASPSVVLNSASGDFSFRYNSTAVAGLVEIRLNKLGTRAISTFITENWVHSTAYYGYAVSSSSATLTYNTWTTIPGCTYVGQTGELNTFRIYDLSNGITYILELNLVNNSGVYESMILQEY